MNEHFQISKTRLKSLAKISIFFLAVGIGWMLFGDNILSWFDSNNDVLTNTLEHGEAKANHQIWAILLGVLLLLLYKRVPVIRDIVREHADLSQEAEDRLMKKRTWDESDKRLAGILSICSTATYAVTVLGTIWLAGVAVNTSALDEFVIRFRIWRLHKVYIPWLFVKLSLNRLRRDIKWEIRHMKLRLRTWAASRF